MYTVKLTLAEAPGILDGQVKLRLLMPCWFVTKHANDPYCAEVSITVSEIGLYTDWVEIESLSDSSGCMGYNREWYPRHHRCAYCIWSNIRTLLGIQARDGFIMYCTASAMGLIWPTIRASQSLTANLARGRGQGARASHHKQLSVVPAADPAELLPLGIQDQLPNTNSGSQHVVVLTYRSTNWQRPYQWIEKHQRALRPYLSILWSSGTI